MADVEATNGDHLDSKYGDEMKAAVSHFLDNSKVKSNGIREVAKAAYVAALGMRGVTEAEVKRVHEAIDFQNTAAAHVALADLETKIGEAPKESLDDAEFRKGLSSTVRLPTFGGATEVTLQAETSSVNPFRGAGEPAEPKINYGRLRTTINTKNRIHSNFHEEATSRIRAALGAPATADVD